MAEACHKKSGKLVAIKRIADFDDWEYSMVQVLREVQLMRELNKIPGGNKFIPKLYDVLMHEHIDKSSG